MHLTTSTLPIGKIYYHLALEDYLDYFVRICKTSLYNSSRQKRRQSEALVLYEFCGVHFELGLMYNNLVFTEHRDRIHHLPGHLFRVERPLSVAECNPIT
jgi:hypothetical protein